jgi:uncharacterized protein (TIGR03032 family)
VTPSVPVTPTVVQKPEVSSVSTQNQKTQQEQQQGTAQQQQQQQQRQQAANNPQFEFDRYFLSWLSEVNHSFVISSYKTHKVFNIGVVKDPRDGQNKLSLWINHFNRPMGLHASEDTVWVSSSGNLWKFENSGKWVSDVEGHGEFDANYIPRMAYFSSDVDTHDLCVDSEGNPYYVSALFSCVCTPSDTHTFKVHWSPPWISKVAPEDRCHLNGVCSRDGKPRYVTAVCQADVKGAWRDHRVGKGIAYDMIEDRLVCEGLSMPHSPRWHDGKLWILDAGTGNLGYVVDGKFENKCFIPGYLRGLSFINNRYAVVGSSQDRHENVFSGLPLGEELKKRGGTSKCGFYVIDLQTFDIIHNLTFYSPVDELYDVCAIKGVRRPKLTDVGDEKNLREYKIEYQNK